MSARRPRASANPFTAVLLDPKFAYTLVVALGSAFGFTAIESGEKRDDGFRDGFNLCRELAFEARNEGKQKIIPKFREELLEEVPNLPAQGQ